MLVMVDGRNDGVVIYYLMWAVGDFDILKYVFHVCLKKSKCPRLFLNIFTVALPTFRT